MNPGRIGLVVATVCSVAAGCGGGAKAGDASGTVAACHTFCAKVVAAACALPVYASVDECQAMECGDLGRAPARCQQPLKSFYDCEGSQTDICADTGCPSQFAAVLACASSGGVGGASGMGGAGGIGGSSGNWTPTALGARLVLWLDASQEAALSDGAAVSTWADRSGAGNSATQSTASSRPRFAANGINGSPAVLFDGLVTFLRIADAPTLRWGTQEFTIAAVAQAAADTAAYSMLYHKSDFASPYAGPTFYLSSAKPVVSTKAGIQLDANTYALTSAGYGDEQPHLYVGRFIATTPPAGMLEIRVDGAPQGTLAVTSPINQDAVGQPGYIGHNGDGAPPGAQALRGSIAEMIGIKGALSATELASLEAYLLQKYALP